MVNVYITLLALMFLALPTYGVEVSSNVTGLVYDCEVAGWRTQFAHCGVDCSSCDDLQADYPDSEIICLNIHPDPINSGNSYLDDCNPDTTAVQCGANCVPVDHCDTNPCEAGETCITIPGGFECMDASTPPVDYVRRCVKYTVYTEDRTWSEASTDCKADGSDLARIINSKQQQFFKDNLPLSTFWFGGTDAVTEGTWLYEGFGDNVCYNNWQGGSTPENADEDCAFLKWDASDLVWEDEDCTTPMPKFVCETSFTF